MQRKRHMSQWDRTSAWADPYEYEEYQEYRGRLDESRNRVEPREYRAVRPSAETVLPAYLEA